MHIPRPLDWVTDLNARRMWPRLEHTRSISLLLLLLLLALALGLTSTAQAIPPRVIVPQDSGVFHATPIDAALPNTPPYAIDGLMAQLVGAKVVGLHGVSVASQNVAGDVQIVSDTTYGRVARFDNRGRLQLKLPPGLLAKTTQTVAGKPQPFGFGLSFFYRFHQSPGQRVKGWLPVLSLAKLNQAWSAALVLKNGVPVFVRKNNTGALFDVGSIAVGHAPSLRIDDGKWHHLVLNAVQPNAATTGCGHQVGAACAGKVLLRMYVDGVLIAAYRADLGRSLRQIEIGALGVNAGAYAAQANWLANPPSLLPRGLIDDTMLYRRALTIAEIGRLATRRRVGLVSQWPAFTPSSVAVPSTTIPGAPGAAQPTPHLGFKATTHPLFVTNSSSSGAGGGAEDLSGSDWSFAAVMRRNGQKWLAQVQTTSGWIGLWVQSGQAYAACGAGNGAWSSGGSTFAKVALGGAGAANEWRNFAIMRGSKTYVLFGQSIAKLACPAGSIPGKGAVLRMRPLGTPGSEAAADVARALLFNRALPIDELWATAFTRPSLWLDPTKTEANGAALRRFPTPLGLNWAGTPPPNGTLGTPGKASTGVIGVGTLHGLEVPGLPTNHAFTVSLRVTPTKGGTGKQDIQLLRRTKHGNPGVFDLDIRLVCEYGGSGCQVYLLTPSEVIGGTSGQWRIERRLPWGKPITLTVSWPVTGLVATSDPKKLKLDVAPRVAINGRVENRLSADGTNGVVDLLPVWKKWGAHKQPARTGWWEFQVGGIVAPSKAQLLDLRLYPYAMQDVGAVGARCATLACGDAGRMCAEADAANVGASAFCHGCDASHVAIAGYGKVERQCVAKSAFYGACITGAECASGVCDGSTQRCKATNSSKSTCVAYCADRGRRCINAGAGTWTCGNCRAYYQRLPGYAVFAATHPDLQCTWHPTKRDQTLCTQDVACMSGLCSEVLEPRFSVKKAYIKNPPYGWGYAVNWVANNASLVKRRRCAARSAAVCEQAPRFRRAERHAKSIYAPDCALTPNNMCGGGKTCEPLPTYRCKRACSRASRELHWTILSPAACKGVIEENLRLQPHSHYASNTGSSFGAARHNQTRSAMVRGDFTLNDLKLTFLHKTGNYNPNYDYGPLIAAGVGRVMIEYARANSSQKTKMRQQYGNFSSILDCTNAAAYNNPTYNYEACEPKLQPVGASCAPPGESGSGHDFCVTNYCARDTKRCDYGDNPVLEPRPSAGNKGREGKKKVKFGIVRCDDTTIEIRDDPKIGGDNDYRYVADLTIAYCLRMFGHYVPPHPVLQGLFHIDRSKGKACAAYQFKAYIAGIPLAMGKPKSLFGSCTGMKITNGQVCEQANCSPGPLLTGNLSELFNALKGGAFMTTGGAEPGCVPLEGTPVGELIDNLTVLKTQTVGPIPLAVQFGPTLDICIDPLVGVGDEGVPKVTIRPSIGLGIDARGGIGLAEGKGKDKAIKFWAGVQLLLDVVKLGFPIGWGVDVKDVPGHLGMWKLQLSQRIGIDLELFSGSFSLFAEVALGPFSFGYRLKLFAWTGLLFEWELSEVPLWSTKLDNKKPQIIVGPLPNHNHGAWFAGKKCEGLCGK